jgi:ribosomal protein L13
MSYYENNKEKIKKKNLEYYYKNYNKIRCIQNDYFKNNYYPKNRESIIENVIEKYNMIKKPKKKKHSRFLHINEIKTTKYSDKIIVTL